MNIHHPGSGRLIIVSNRLPFTVHFGNSELQFDESAGGLVTGLSAFLDSYKDHFPKQEEHVWVGWPGNTIPDEFKDRVRAKALADYHAYPVFLSEADMDHFYLGFCNKTIWPLFHYFPSYAVYQEEYWQNYRHVNELFREALLELIQPDDTVWVQDYHLMLLPRLLRERLPDVLVGFFLHIPFPSFEIFRLLPPRWRTEILEGLLGADLVGFHTYEYMQHFLQSAMRILGHEHTTKPLLRGRGDDDGRGRRFFDAEPVSGPQSQCHVPFARRVKRTRARHDRLRIAYQFGFDRLCQPVKSLHQRRSLLRRDSRFS